MSTVLRVSVIYVFILIALRILGKREFGQLSPLELVSLLMIPELVSQALVDDDFSVTNALVGVTTLLSLVFVTSLLMQRFRKAEDIITGTPTVLVSRGRMIEEAMNKMRVTPGEIFAEMRKSGIERLAQVKWAVLEADGKISIVPEEPRVITQRGGEKDVAV